MDLILRGVLGISLFYGVAWAISENRSKIDVKTVLLGLAVQVPLAFLLTKWGVLDGVFSGVTGAVIALRDATITGTSFVFGYLGDNKVPFMMKPGANEASSTFIFALQALPMIIVVNALSMLLFYFKVIPVIVRVLSHVFERLLKLGGALGLCTSAELFLGQTEAPLLIKPYLEKLTRGELFTVMALGMATSSIPAMILYSGILIDIIPNNMTHIFAALILNIVTVLTLSRIMVPSEKDTKADDVSSPYKFSGAMDAISQGTMDGMTIFASVVAIIMVFVALIALINKFLAFLVASHLFPMVGGEVPTLEMLLSYVMAPVVWLMGISWGEAFIAGKLFAMKTVLNEIIAYLDFANNPGVLSAKGQFIMTYVLCSFANFSSVGIQIAGFGVMVPKRREEIISLSYKALGAGILASCITGALVGLFV
ncbi:nucleoside:proton symporter [Alphaproteobacteria bacterium]|nr:nucleoside:proton symporter [Alphaproteobacteria bacterium]